MNSEKTLIHVGFQYDEAIKAKIDLLSLEMNLLEATKAMANYHSLRSEELRLKLKLYLKTKESLVSFKQLKRLLPKYKLPKILKEIEGEKEKIEKEKEREKMDREKMEKKMKEKQEVKYGSDVDSQLEKIQDKLKSLQ